MKWRYANQQMKAIAISLSKSIRPCDLGVCVMVCSPPLRLKSVSCRSVFTGYFKSVVTAYFCACEPVPSQCYEHRGVGGP